MKCVIPTCRTHADTEPGAMTCKPCRLHLLRQLSEIDTYLDIVSPAPGRSGVSGPIGGQFGSRPPVRLDVIAMLDPRTELNGPGQDDIVDEVPNVYADLQGWSRVVHEEHPDHPGGHGAWYLRSWIGWICRQPWVDELARDVGRVHRALRQACGDGPGKSHGTCLKAGCGGEVFRRSDDPQDPRLRCERCRVTFDGLDLGKIRRAS